MIEGLYIHNDGNCKFCKDRNFLYVKAEIMIGKKVLIMDDDADLLHLASNIIQNAEAQTIKAHGLELLCEYGYNVEGIH